MARAKNEGIDRSVVNSLTTTLNSIYFSAAIPEKGRKAPMSCLLQFSPGHLQEVEVCAGKHDIQPVLVFLQAPVSDFSIPKLAFDDAEDRLHFASNGGFAAFNISSPVNGLVAYLGELAGAEVDAVVDGG